tara:strand:+ start:232 stop:573 length:342 start_codon:yes stop_codon:yes gene_type:complete
MKKLILTTSLVLLAFSSSFASPAELAKLSYLTINQDVTSDLNEVSNPVQEDIKISMKVDLDDDALQCKVTITVSIGIISDSGTVSGDCDEVKAKAVQLLGELIDQAKELAGDL